MKESFAPQDATKLTGDKKKSALESLMFLKENRDGTIKGGGMHQWSKEM
jgi:hypothetical protein